MIKTKKSLLLKTIPLSLLLALSFITGLRLIHDHVHHGAPSCAICQTDTLQIISPPVSQAIWKTNFTSHVTYITEAVPHIRLLSTPTPSRAPPK